MENVAFNVGNEAFFDEVMMALVGGEVAAPLVEVHLRGAQRPRFAQVEFRALDPIRTSPS
jgi:hypothetical protein